MQNPQKIVLTVQSLAFQEKFAVTLSGSRACVCEWCLCSMYVCRVLSVCYMCVTMCICCVCECVVCIEDMCVLVYVCK